MRRAEPEVRLRKTGFKKRKLFEATLRRRDENSTKVKFIKLDGRGSNPLKDQFEKF